jgi:hypothetical protein
MCLPSGKTFHLISWPWPSDLWPWRDLLSQNFNLGHNFSSVSDRASYFICVCILARLFIWYHVLDPLFFDLGVWLSFLKL